MKFNDFEKMKSGKFYNSDGKTLFAPHVKGLVLQDRYNRTPIWNVKKQQRIIKRLIPEAGENFCFFPPFHCKYGCNIKFGKNFFMNFGCTLLDVSPITIGDNVMFGAGVTIATPCHPLVAEERIIRQYPDGCHDLEYSKPVTIGNNVWLASNVTVCGGVTIGDNVVIGAGSVVTKDIPTNVIAYGIPCKVIRHITDDDKMNPWESYVNDEMPQTAKQKSAK